MKIFVTGATGRIGSKLIPMLSLRHKMVTLQRFGGDIDWQLGEIPVELLNEDLNDSVFIHLAWSTRDRSKTSHANVGGTIVLTQFLKDLGVPMLFISSASATTSSIYGQSKLKAELVSEEGATIYRFGLIPECSPYLIGRKNIGIALWDKTILPITSLKCVENSIETFISQPISGEKREIIEHFSNMGSLLKNSTRIIIKIPTPLVAALFRAFSPISARARDFYDATKSLKFHAQN